MILLPDHHSICSLTHQILTIQQFILCCPEQSYYTPQFICYPLELMPDREAALAELNAIGVPGVVYGCETVTRCGVQGTHMSVKINGAEESEAMHEHSHDHHDHDEDEDDDIISSIEIHDVPAHVEPTDEELMERL